MKMCYVVIKDCGRDLFYNDGNGWGGKKVLMPYENALMVFRRVSLLANVFPKGMSVELVEE